MGTEQKAQQLFEELEAAMKKQGITIYAIHKKTGLPKQTVYDLFKKGYLLNNLETLAIVCSALDIEITLKKSNDGETNL